MNSYNPPARTHRTDKFPADSKGPLPDGVAIGTDYYKPNMSQLAFEQEPDAEVTFTFHNRGQQRLLDYVNLDALRQRLDSLRAKSWSEDELAYLGSLRRDDGEPMYSADYLTYLKINTLPPLTIRYDERINDIAIETTGPWALSTFWETIVMSEINEAYFEGYVQAHGLNPMDVYEEGDRRLSEKIALLQQHPDIKIVDFGTRRHFSFRWQQHVVGRLAQECPQNLIGTSNVALAEYFGLKPTGTYAHELPMIYAGLADARGYNVRASHNQSLQDWYARYGEQYSIGLTDTFTTDFFFADFTPEQAAAWRGVRHDSGDPFKFGERLIQYYDKLGIDPRDKTLVFSDGLDITTIIDLHYRFKDRINVIFGWGTTLTNDLGMKPLNIVMKATHVRIPQTGQEAKLVKLSDDSGKHTGPKKLVTQYKQEHFSVAA